MRRMQEKMRYTVLIGQPHGNRQFLEAVCRTEDSIQKCLRVVGYEGVGLIILI
jgi:hypothetical protein